MSFSSIFKLLPHSNIPKLSISQINSSTLRFIATRKRFYKKCNVISGGNGKFEITLDHRKLKTPKGALFQVTSEPLALAVAAEWDSQREKIAQSSMHLTGLCSTVLDNPEKLIEQDIVNSLVKYLDTDTILYLSETDGELLDLQIKHWIPVTDWLCHRYDVNIKPTRDITGPLISDADRDVIRKSFLSHNIWSLFGFRFAIEALKSVILGMACVDRFLTVEEAVRLSRLEEEFQSKRWGRVEWAHDLNEHDTRARVAAGVLFSHLNSSNYWLKTKSANTC